MSILPNFVRSLLLTIFFSFVAPIVLITILLATFSVIGYIPGVATIGHVSAAQLLKFLAIFGQGCPFEGAIIIGLTCSLVGALFDTYASAVIRT